MSQRKIIIVGIGIYSVYSHLQDLRYLKIPPVLAVDLMGNRNQAREILDAFGFNNTELFCVSDYCKDDLYLSDAIQGELTSLLSKHNIDGAIVATEPKAHNAYIDYFLSKQIPVFCDKPLVAIKNCSTDIEAANELGFMQEDILSLAKKTRIDINLSRRTSNRYTKLKNELREVCNLTQMPITQLEIYSSGGKIKFDQEYFRENHPYQYGYGHLFHSGFHFVDLMAELLELSPVFKYDDIKVHTIKTPLKDYTSIQGLKKLYGHENQEMVWDQHSWGEMDLYSTIQFFYQGNVVSTVQLTLLATGFSRRSERELSPNVYAQGGRVRHERVNAHVGPVFNAQLHEYQVNKTKTEIGSKYETPIGEVYLFRNKELIGGEEFERIPLPKRNEEGPIDLFLENKKSPCTITNLSLSLKLFDMINKSLI